MRPCFWDKCSFALSEATFFSFFHLTGSFVHCTNIFLRFFKNKNLIFESAPKTPKPNFTALQLVENQYAFSENFGKKTFRRGLIFRMQTPLVGRSVVAESEAGMLFVVELDAPSDGSLELLQEATSLQYETYCRLSLDPAVRHIRQTVSISVSRATSFGHPVGVIAAA